MTRDPRSAVAAPSAAPVPGGALADVAPIGPTSPASPTSAGDEPAACARAVAATRDAPPRRDQANAARASTGKPLIDFGVGPHVGDVVYGNIEVPERLRGARMPRAVFALPVESPVSRS